MTVAEWFSRHGSMFAAIGGCVLAVFWVTVAFQISVPWAISLPFHAVGMVTLAAGVIALQQEQARGRSDAPWSWIPTLGVALSVFVSFEVFLVSTILFALTAIKLGRLSKRGAVLLIVGSGAFLIAFFLHGPFWSTNNPDPSLPLAFVFATGLVIMAAGWVLLGFDRPEIPPRTGEDREATSLLFDG